MHLYTCNMLWIKEWTVPLTGLASHATVNAEGQSKQHMWLCRQLHSVEAQHTAAAT